MSSVRECCPDSSDEFSNIITQLFTLKHSRSERTGNEIFVRNRTLTLGSRFQLSSSRLYTMIVGTARPQVRTAQWPG